MMIRGKGVRRLTPRWYFGIIVLFAITTLPGAASIAADKMAKSADEMLAKLSAIRKRIAERKSDEIEMNFEREAIAPHYLRDYGGLRTFHPLLRGPKYQPIVKRQPNS